MTKEQSFLKRQIDWLLKEKYHGKFTTKARTDIEKLKKGESLDYLIGFVEFLSVKIDLKKRPLIPRQETEFWVEKAIKEIRTCLANARQNLDSSLCSEKGGEKKKPECLDLFSGSGAIGLAVLKHIPGAQVDFGEINKDFLEQIRFNLWLNGPDKSKASIIQTDVFSNINQRYDYIFANPPYIALERKKKAQKSVLRYEPKSALFAGKDGLLYIEKFLKQAKKYLKPYGKIYLEFDSWQKPKISALLKKEEYKNFEFFKDQYNRWRYAKISVS